MHIKRISLRENEKKKEREREKKIPTDDVFVRGNKSSGNSWLKSCAIFQETIHTMLVLHSPFLPAEYFKLYYLSIA